MGGKDARALTLETTPEPTAHLPGPSHLDAQKAEIGDSASGETQ